jgi:hypothetical protein
LPPIYLAGAGGRLRAGKDSEGGRGKKERRRILDAVIMTGCPERERERERERENPADTQSDNCKIFSGT